MTDRIPEMHHIMPDDVEKAIVGEVSVSVRRGNSTIPVREMIDEVVGEILEVIGVAPTDTSLRSIGNLVGVCVVGRLAAEDALTIQYGDPEHPTKITEVTLGSVIPQSTDATAKQRTPSYTQDG